MDIGAAFQVYSLNHIDQKARVYKKRTFSSKTKSGCLVCKEKRVKCDELRPICVRCQRNGRTCTYEILGSAWRTPTSDRTSTNSSDTSPPWTDSALSPIFDPKAESATLNNALIHHLHNHWSDILLMPNSFDLISLFKSDLLVRNTMLAITASHLRHVVPCDIEHRIAEHTQQYLALRDYQRALDTPQQMSGQSGADILLLSGALLSILAFALPYVESAKQDGAEIDLSTSWVFSTKANRLDWLSLQVGLRPFILSMGPYFEQSLSFVSKIFLGTEMEGRTFARSGPIPKTIPDRWIVFFGLDATGYEHGCEASNVFYPPVKAVAELRSVEPVRSNIYKTLQFLGKVSPKFRILLYDRNEKALWLFGYWLGIMCRFEGIWWADRRVKRDYKAIWLWLQQLRLQERPGVEGNRWGTMMEELELAPVSGATS